MAAKQFPNTTKITAKNPIIVEIKDKTAVITINNYKSLNSLNGEQYQLLAEAMEVAAAHPDTIVTLLQATGRFFSAGAQVNDPNLGLANEPEDTYVKSNPENKLEGFESKQAIRKRTLIGTFAARNLYLSQLFYNHPKALVCALNGPVIGFSAALVAMADFIYCTDAAFLLTPFANLGLVTEGVAAYSLLQRLGLSTANEALLQARPIYAQELYRLGFANEVFSTSNFKTADDFNDHIQEMIKSRFYHLSAESIFDIKKIIQLSMRPMYDQVNSVEVIGGLDKFSRNIPQGRFALIAAGKLKHKL